MEFVEGRVMVVNGSGGQIRQLMHYLPRYFFHKGKRVLIFDTTNCLNPHNKYLQGEFQQEYFTKTWCVRTPMPYDLWARLRASGGFVKKKGIGVVLVTGLSRVFKDASVRETQALVNSILVKLKDLTQMNSLITIVGNCEGEEESVMTAFDFLSREENVVRIEVDK